MERANYSNPPLISEGSIEAERKFYDLQIVGDGRFTKRTHKALDLLREHAPVSYDSVRANIGIIQQVGQWRVGIIPWEPLPIFLVTNEHTRNKKWYAGAMVHDAWHSFLYHQWLSSHPGETHVPDDAWGGKAIEEECLQKQYEALVQLKAPHHMLRYVREDVIKTEYWNTPVRKRGILTGEKYKTSDETVQRIISKRLEGIQ